MRHSSAGNPLPYLVLAGTQGVIEGYTLTPEDEGAIAYATDLNRGGYYDGGDWVWNQDVSVGASPTFVGITITGPVEFEQLDVIDITVDTATHYYGILNRQTKTLGATGAHDFFGFYNRTAMNQVGGTIRYLDGIVNELTFTAGTVTDLDVFYSEIDANAGAVTGQIYGGHIYVNVAAPVTVAGDIYGHFIRVTTAMTPTGDTYMMYLDEGVGIDYGIFQNGTAPNIFGGDIGFQVAAPTGVVHIAGSAAGAAGTGPLKFEAGTVLAAPEAGVLEYNGSCLFFTEVVDRRVISLASDSIITPVTATLAAETVIYTATISAVELHAYKVLRVKGFGKFSTHDASDQVTVRVYLGVVLIVALQSTAGGVTDKPWHLDVDMTIRTTGVGGTVSGHGYIMLDTKEVHTNTSSQAIDTTGANDITITAEWSDTLNSLTIDQGYLEVLN